MEDFVTWLNTELNARGWSRSELARRGGVSAEAISQAISGKTRPGLKLCRAVAKAFGLSLEEVQRRAGLLPTYGAVPPRFKELGERLRKLSNSDQQFILDTMEDVLNLAETKPEYRTRPASPPDDG
jgi:transcriptional regulator with XRE-family HTH domain